MKKQLITMIILTILIFNLSGQDIEFGKKYNLTICTITRDAKATLEIKDSTGNTFTGIFTIDGDERDVFGWYIEKKSEGGGYLYNTEGITFYVDLKKDFQHLQLFKGLFNYDKSYISGTYFYWGNEFIFYGNKEDKIDNIILDLVKEDLEIYPNPVANELIIDSKSIKYQKVDIYNMTGNRISTMKYTRNINVDGLESGIYIMVLTDKNNNTEKIKFIKTDK